MQTMQLGNNNLTVSALGLGCMGMSEFYGETNEQESTNTICRAFDLGVTHFDTADCYGAGHNEILLGNATRKFRDKIKIATKFGIVRDPVNIHYRGVDNSPTYIRKACEASLKNLGTDYIDLFYIHRIDPNIPIEVSVQTLSDLVKEGKILNIGLSEVSAENLTRAHKVHPIAAVQTEYSLWSRGVENKILPLCQKLGIGFVAYSPLGRGFLSGKINSINHLAADDFRRNLPRFQNENITDNLNQIQIINKIAAQKNCTEAQIALAWILAQGDYITAIPGTKRVKYLEENIAATNIILSEDELIMLNKGFPHGIAKGTRYPSVTNSTFGQADA